MLLFVVTSFGRAITFLQALKCSQLRAELALGGGLDRLSESERNNIAIGCSF
jgi:hypothetical protein